MSFWESREAIDGFAGQDIEKAVFYPEDERFLVERDLTVRHYEVTGRSRAPNEPGGSPPRTVNGARIHVPPTLALRLVLVRKVVPCRAVIAAPLPPDRQAWRERAGTPLSGQCSTRLGW